MAAIFVPNPTLVVELERAGTLTPDERQAADAIVAAAQAIAPVDTGAYRASIRAIEDGNDVGVITDSEYGAFLEFGTADTPTFATLRRAGESVGKLGSA